MYCLVNGRLVRAERQHISALDRGFTLGDGVFETMLAVGGKTFRLDQHLARLQRGAATLRLTLPDVDLAADISRVLEANALLRAVLRLTVSRGPAVRGLLPPGRANPSVVLQVGPFREPAGGKLVAGFSAIVSAIRRNESSPLSRIKSCNYLDNVLARLEASDAGADEALMLNTAGSVACCSAANVHLVSSRRVQTPSPEAGALPGITRKCVRGLCDVLALEWEERDLPLEAFWSADEAFITNTVVGVVALTSLSGRPIGSGRPGAVTLELAERYRELVRSEVG